MKKKPQNPKSKKKAREEKKDAAPKKEESKWQEFLRRHSQAQEKK